MTRAIALALLVALSGPMHAAVTDARPKPDQWLPDRELIVRLERATKMPQGATAIENYVRYYTGWRGAVSGHRLVYGAIISPDLSLFGKSKPRPDIKIVEPHSMPDFLARNCGIVMLEFNVDTDESVVRCAQP